MHPGDVSGLEGLVPDHQRPRNPCVLVGEGDGGDVDRAPRQKTAQPGGRRVVTPLPAHHRAGAMHEQPPEITVAPFADAAEPLLPATGSLARDEPEPSRELPSRTEVR